MSNRHKIKVKKSKGSNPKTIIVVSKTTKPIKKNNLKNKKS